MKRWFLLPAGGLIKVMLACGVVQISAYYMVATLATPGTHLSVPQPDTLLYCQSARQIAEGMPYVFSPGDKPSTGSTSHAYPFLLAALYKTGATGDVLLTAGFVLNAVFYLIFLANWGSIVCRLLVSPWMRTAACALLALNGQTAYSALSQSDVGLFMAVSSGIFAALLSGQLIWCMGLLAFAPWCRPEGALLAVLYVGMLGVRRCVWAVPVRRVEWMTAIVGVGSALSVFVFNLWLTDYAQYQSVYYKGYFKQLSFFPALNLTLGDVFRIGRELFLGEPDEMPRASYWLPLLGSLFAWLGVMIRPWRRIEAWKEIWWLLACGACVGVVASSGWQGMNTDRYFAWLLPIWLVYMASGAVWLGRRFPNGAAKYIPFLVIMAFQMLSAVWLVSNNYSACLFSQQTYDFMKDVHVALPALARVGSDTGVFAYAFPGRRYVHLSGIYSPAFLCAAPILNLERLKHHREGRFDYWILQTDQASFYDAPLDYLSGPVMMVGANACHIREARWDALDRALFPLDSAVLNQTKDWRLADRLDVGYPEDERRCSYSTGSRFYGNRYEPFSYATNGLFEVGRMIAGWENLTIHVKPRLHVRVVLRTAAKVATGVNMGVRSGRQTFTFTSPLKLRVHVDGKETEMLQLPLQQSDVGAISAFNEITFVLPAELFQKEKAQLAIYGDHASFAYWFYQPE